MVQNKPIIIVRGYSLTDLEEKIIKKVSSDRALFNDSAALRQIIREWAETQVEKSAEVVQ